MSGKNENNDEKVEEFVVTSRWESCMAALFINKLPYKDRIIVKSIKENRGHLLSFMDLLVDKLRYMLKVKEWNDNEKVQGKKREVIKIELEKIGACRR